PRGPLLPCPKPLGLTSGGDADLRGAVFGCDTNSTPVISLVQDGRVLLMWPSSRAEMGVGSHHPEKGSAASLAACTPRQRGRVHEPVQRFRRSEAPFPHLVRACTPRQIPTRTAFPQVRPCFCPFVRLYYFFYKSCVGEIYAQQVPTPWTCHVDIPPIESFTAKNTRTRVHGPGK